MLTSNKVSGRTASENKKTVFRTLKPNKIQDFESLQRKGKKFKQAYMSLSYIVKHLRDILNFINFFYHEYKVKMKVVSSNIYVL